MPCASDLRKRSALVRRLLRYREMLPGSLVFTRTKCGKPGCACAQGEDLHPVCQFVTKLGGKTKTLYIPPDLVPWVRERFAQYKAFQKDAAEIGRINLEFLLSQKDERTRMRRSGRRP